MQKFKDALREEQKRLEEIIAKAKKENEHMPEGNLRISKHKNRCRYYHCVHDRNGIYIPKRNMMLREQLAQKAYNSSIINIAEEQLAKINKMLEIDADEKMKKMYDSLHPDRKKLINPIEDTWENNLQKWFAAPYQGKEFQEGAPMILTENGERVRSKSEKILADEGVWHRLS